MVNYDAQVNQMPQPYRSVGTMSSNKRKLGATLAGSMLGMCAYYLPVGKDTFVNRAFDITKRDANQQILQLKDIAIEVEKNKVSTQSKMILQDLGLSEDVIAITNKCSELDRSVSDPVKVKALKDDFAKNYSSYKKDVSLMDNTCAEAFKNAKRNKFKWGAGIGAAIGLALSLLSSND